MSKSKCKPIEVSSSPEPSNPLPKRPNTRAKLKAAPSNIPVIELTDSDDDQPSAHRVSRPKSTTNAIAGPSNIHRLTQQLGNASSVENIPSRRKETPARGTEPLFLSSDEENKPPRGHVARARTPMVLAPFPLKLNMDVDADEAIASVDQGEQQAHVPNEPTPEWEVILDLDIPHIQPKSEQEPEVALDPTSVITARVIEIIPDVEPDHLLALITAHTVAHPDQDVNTVVELLLHALFDDPTYPKVDRLGKGKRKLVQEETPSKKVKLDFRDKMRPYRGGEGYREMAVEHLQIAFPYVPRPYLRAIIAQHNGHYAPAYLFILEQEKEGKELPYVKRATPYRPKGKSKDVPDVPELVAELRWVAEYLEGGSESKSDDAKEIVEESDGECEAEDGGVQCGCCFSFYRFVRPFLHIQEDRELTKTVKDKIIQCPETHLFCSTCMITYASTLLGSHDPNIKCMDQSGCKAPFPYSQLQRFLTPKLLALYDRVKQRKEVQDAGLEGLEECPFCEWGCVIENGEEKLLRCGNMEMCGRQQSAVLNAPIAGGSSHPNKSKCLLWESVEYRDANEVLMHFPTLYDYFADIHTHMKVKAAAERAQEQYRRDNPDVDDNAIKVDIPVAPVNPHQEVVNNAQAAYDRAVAEQQRIENEEQKHRATMLQREKHLVVLQETGKRMPEMKREYERRAEEVRREIRMYQETWYRLRSAAERERMAVGMARAALEQARKMAQPYGAIAGMGAGAGLALGIGDAVLPPPRYVRRPVRAKAARAPRRRK
ncbi:hypothetical protein C0991_006116 [Blastosporella zonata]|nr:hypothetical protein C0991_006116 [Blastosporella zonata]